MLSRLIHRVAGFVVAAAFLLIPVAAPASANASSPHISVMAPIGAISDAPPHTGATSCGPWRPVPGPADGLTAMSAAAANDIWAVGTTGQEGSQRGVIAHWDGAHWSAVPSPNPPAVDNRFSGVAAISATDAWAVGSTVNPAGPNSHGRLDQPLIEHWDGRRWTLAADPLPSTDYYLTAIAAVSGTDVWAVGTIPGGTRTIIAHWDGRGWRVVPGAALGPNGGSLYAVTAVAADDVWAVGDVVGGYRTPLIEHWDGRRWQVSAGPTFPGDSVRLNGVSALSRHDVWAVGGYGSNPYGVGGPLIVHWDGVRWRVVPAIDTQSALYGVAAVSSRDVWATGGSVVAHWDGARWHGVPAPTGGLGALAVVAPRDVWGLDAGFERYTGDLCYTSSVVARTVAVGNAGIQDAGMGTTADGPGALVVDSASGRAFVRDAAGVVSAIDLVHDTVMRRESLNASGVPAIDARGGRVFVPSTGGSGGAGSVQALDATTGAVVRSFVVGARPSAVAFDARSGRLAVAEAGDVRVLDATSGATIATVPISNPTALAGDGRSGRVFVASNGHAAYSGDSPSSLVMLDAASGAVVTTTAGIGGQIAVDESAGRVFVGHVDSEGTRLTLRVSVLDATTGRVLRTINIGQNGDAYLAALAVDQATGRVFIASYFGLQALDPATGRLRTLDAGAPNAIAVDARGGRVYATYVDTTNQYGIPVGPGSVAVFDATTGARLTTVTVGQGPDAVAVDEASGRVLVLDQRGVDALDAAAGVTTRVQPPLPADPIAPAAAQPGVRYFPQARHTLTDPFLTYWLRYGGVDAFGYPRTEPFVGDARLTQYTDRALLRVVDGQVTPAPLGRLLTAGRSFPRVEPFRSTPTRLYFPATGHSLSGRFLAYWQGHAGARLLGAPLSAVIVEGNGDGSARRYPLQWFERGRLEYHPELAGTRYAVEVGLVGLQALRRGTKHDSPARFEKIS